MAKLNKPGWQKTRSFKESPAGKLQSGEKFSAEELEPIFMTTGDLDPVNYHKKLLSKEFLLKKATVCSSIRMGSSF